MATQLAEEGDFDLLSTIYDIIKRYILFMNQNRNHVSK